jgi:hypothetical protein
VRLGQSKSQPNEHCLPILFRDENGRRVIVLLKLSRIRMRLCTHVRDHPRRMTPSLEQFLQRRPYNAVDFVDANVARGLGNKIAFTDSGM